MFVMLVRVRSLVCSSLYFGLPFCSALNPPTITILFLDEGDGPRNVGCSQSPGMQRVAESELMLPVTGKGLCGYERTHSRAGLLMNSGREV